MGFEFLNNNSTEITLNILGNEKKIQFLHVFEFDGIRKRMSIIVKDDGIYKLLIKGADDVMTSRLNKEN